MARLVAEELARGDASEPVARAADSIVVSPVPADASRPGS
jgi:hypothetical protein